MELKREVAGTSQIEGADFTEHELDAAISGDVGKLRTRSQKQVRSALEAYEWIAKLEDDRPIDQELIREIHRHIVTGCDDDHCPPGQLRKDDQNVNFGKPKHRGVKGGDDCDRVFSLFVKELDTSFRGHDILIQALAAHYHFAAMHPFLDGNGRTARALEALMLGRAGLRDTCFIAMSNYYYEEKPKYLATLRQVRSEDYDLTSLFFVWVGGHQDPDREIDGSNKEADAETSFQRHHELFFGEACLATKTSHNRAPVQDTANNVKARGDELDRSKERGPDELLGAEATSESVHPRYRLFRSPWCVEL